MENNVLRAYLLLQMPYRLTFVRVMILLHVYR